MKRISPSLSALLMIVALIMCIFAGCTDNSESSEPSYPAVVTKAATEAVTTTLAKEKETTSAPELTAAATTSTAAEETTAEYIEYHFRSSKLLNEHFEKHGGEFAEDFGYSTAAEYEKGASDVINNSDALFKYEAEDGDGVYYIEGTNEFVILSTDGYIRTYFRPSSGKKYFDRQ